MLTPEDLKKKTFSKGFRGYETAEVDKFMQELIKEYNYFIWIICSKRKLSKE